MDNHKDIREGSPDQNDPREIGVNPPGKDRKAQEKTDIKESELGREQGQTPADEHIEHRISQIDNETAKMQTDNNDMDKKNGE